MIFNKKYNFLPHAQIEKNEQKFYIDNIKEGDIVFDVGANIGLLTMLFSKFCGNSGQVHSFEPTPTTYKKLTAIVRNLGTQNITLNLKAVSNEDGFINFNVYGEEYSSWNTIATRPLENYGINIDKPTPIKVPSITIDNYCVTNSIEHIDLLKIDVEGAELSVLKGAEVMFSRKKIKLCVFEFGQTIFDMGTTVAELSNFFYRHGYTISNVSKNQNIFPIDGTTKHAIFSVLFARSK